MIGLRRACQMILLHVSLGCRADRRSLIQKAYLILLHCLLCVSSLIKLCMYKRYSATANEQLRNFLYAHSLKVNSHWLYPDPGTDKNPPNHTFC